MVDVVAKWRSESTYSSAEEKSSGYGSGFSGGMMMYISDLSGGLISSFSKNM